MLPWDWFVSGLYSQTGYTARAFLALQLAVLVLRHLRGAVDYPIPICCYVLLYGIGNLAFSCFQGNVLVYVPFSDTTYNIFHEICTRLAFLCFGVVCCDPFSYIRQENYTDADAILRLAQYD